MKKVLYFIIFFAILPAFTFAQRTVPITIEQAATVEEKTWGLMQRAELPENHGMLFIYQKPQKLSFWMFNCLIDLSLAFLDENSVITEFRQLRAYPEKMDPKRQVLSLEDLKKYPFFDPILIFFYKKQVSSSRKAQYALEMRDGWFRQNGVKVGDRLVWERSSPDAYFISQ